VVRSLSTFAGEVVVGKTGSDHVENRPRHCTLATGTSGACASTRTVRKANS
jgi:hypothetical protein